MHLYFKWGTNKLVGMEMEREWLRLGLDQGSGNKLLNLLLKFCAMNRYVTEYPKGDDIAETQYAGFSIHAQNVEQLLLHICTPAVGADKRVLVNQCSMRHAIYTFLFNFLFLFTLIQCFWFLAGVATGYELGHRESLCVEKTGGSLPSLPHCTQSLISCKERRSHHQ